MVANGANAKRAVAAVLEGLSRDRGGEEEEGKEVVVVGDRLVGGSRGGVMGLYKRDGRQEEAVGRLRWLFGDEWVDGAAE